MCAKILWECSPKTKAKLQILEHYLGAWFSILANHGFEEVTFFDGFCGPGHYSGGESGSPLIAVRHASHAANRFKNFRPKLIFLDKDSDKIAYLQSLDAFANLNPQVCVHFKCGTFADNVPDIFDEFDVALRAPMFSFVDPKGFGQSPYEMLRPLVHNEHCELFVNFMCGFMHRFKEHPNPDVRERVRDMVGRAFLDRVMAASDPIEELCEVYLEQLKKLGNFARYMVMRDETNVRDNALFFCGRNPKGFVKMKEAMWRIDPDHGCQFSAYAQKADRQTQPRLFESVPQIIELREPLLEKIGDHRNMSVSQLFKWVERDTRFLTTHLRKELEGLYDNGRLMVEDPQGKPRRKGAWPGRLIVTLAPQGEA